MSVPGRGHFYAASSLGMFGPLCFCFRTKKAARETVLKLVLEFWNSETYSKAYGLVLPNTYSIHRMYFFIRWILSRWISKFAEIKLLLVGSVSAAMMASLHYEIPYA